MMLRTLTSKTGAMIEASAKIGALVAQADESLQNALETYGGKLGLAFQVIDDLLDVAGDVSTTGKEIGRDVQLGKLTYPRLIGVDESRRRARQLVDEACNALAPLTSRAANLEALARYVVARDH